MKVAILGYGLEGESACKYWQAKGADITVCDIKTDIAVPSGVSKRLGPDYLQNLDDFDLLVRSPGVRLSEIRTTKPITSGSEEFLAQCPAPVIGVTGTKGKGTTATLIAKMLEAAHSAGSGQAGHKVWLGGNIGVPVLDFLPQVKPTDWVVLELSSFQLMDMDKSPHVAVLLMIEPEHLNWHATAEEYYQAKGNLVRYQSAGDLAVYNAANPTAVRLAQLSAGQKIPYLDSAGAHVAEEWVRMGEVRICPVNEVGLIGPHNLENICAAVAATWEIVKDPAPLRRAIQEFSGLPFRLQLVGEVDGVRYYNDSFGTTPESAIAAVKSFTVPKVLILGGSDKGSDYTQLARAVAKGGVRQVILIGQMGPVIGQALTEAGFTAGVDGGESMAEIVAAARSAARPGGVVLLSPACASFGMFKDYKDRGQQFTAAVAKLKTR